MPNIFSKVYYSSLGFMYKNDPFTPFDKIIWNHGYDYTGDVNDRNNKSGMSEQGVSVYDIYINCIHPFVQNDTKVLEIGAGIGSFTKPMLCAKEVWVLEALSLQNNRILDYLNQPINLRYIQVHDFKCKELPDNYFDFLFSYQTFNFIPFYGIKEYLISLYPKMKPGCNCFIGFSDKDKVPFNVSRGNWKPGFQTPVTIIQLVKLLEDKGWIVISENCLKLERDTIIHFVKQ